MYTMGEKIDIDAFKQFYGTGRTTYKVDVSGGIVSFTSGRIAGEACDKIINMKAILRPEDMKRGRDLGYEELLRRFAESEEIEDVKPKNDNGVFDSFASGVPSAVIIKEEENLNKLLELEDGQYVVGLC